MKDLDDSTLWRVSAWVRFKLASGDSGFARLATGTVLPTTLVADLARLEQRKCSRDPVEVVAACIRHHENTLVLLKLDELVWPLSVFPSVGLYHLPRPIDDNLARGAREFQVVGVEPPGLRPPGHAQWERVADAGAYQPLPPLLWALAMHVPRAALLGEIAGRAAYRVSADFEVNGAQLAGALGPAVQRLRREISSLDDIAAWPGMNRDRATRLINAIYLQGGLMVLRAHHAARDTQEQRSGWLGWMRGGRR